MSDLAEDFRAMREYSRKARGERREHNASLVEKYCIHSNRAFVWVTPYQVRIDGRLDIYPTNRKWHDIKTNVRGTYKNPAEVIARVCR